MVDKRILVGSFRRFGLFGPPYEVLGPGKSGDQRMRVRLLESGEETEYGIQHILADPIED